MNPEKDQKKELKNLYANFPKHLGEDSSQELKIDLEGLKREESSWEIFKRISKKKIFRIILIIIFSIVVINFWFFRYDDWVNGCHMRIMPSVLEWNNLNVKKAISFLRNKSPKDYNKFCTYVNTISPDLPCGGSGGGCFHNDKPKQIEVSVLGHQDDLSITTAIIIHEVCHAVQRNENRQLDEQECYGEGNRFLKEIGLKVPEYWKKYEK